MKINRQELFKLVGFLGIALLISGYLRYSVREINDVYSKALMIAGAVLAVAGVALNFTVIRDHFRQRSTRLGANTAVMTVAVVAILALLNFLGYRHHKRVDVTAEQLYSLSDQTRKIVTNLQKDVRIMKIGAAEGEDPQTLQALRDQVQEYRDLSKRITFEAVDPYAKPEVAQQYGIMRKGDLGAVIVASGDRTQRLDERRPGEQELTSAIIKVTRDKPKTICFVEGHGEKALSSTDADGYALVERGLKQENYETKSVKLASAERVPQECDVLVEAGPKQALFPPEAAMIGKYLDAGGKALLMIDPDTDPQLGDVLKAWNIELGSGTVLDNSAASRIYGLAVPLVVEYGSHPITKDLSRAYTGFPFCRPVNVSNASKGDVSTTELLKTSDTSWAESEVKQNEVPKFDEGKDKKGPINIGVAASKKIADKESRLVVIGDADFATNRFARLEANGNLFLNTLSWLAQEEDLIAIRPKSTTDRRVNMIESQQNLFFWIALLLLPGAVVGSGAYIWWKRR